MSYVIAFYVKESIGIYEYIQTHGEIFLVQAYVTYSNSLLERGVVYVNPNNGQIFELDFNLNYHTLGTLFSPCIIQDTSSPGTYYYCILPEGQSVYTLQPISSIVFYPGHNASNPGPEFFPTLTNHTVYGTSNTLIAYIGDLTDVTYTYSQTTNSQGQAYSNAGSVVNEFYYFDFSFLEPNGEITLVISSETTIQVYNLVYGIQPSS